MHRSGRGLSHLVLASSIKGFIVLSIRPVWLVQLPPEESTHYGKLKRSYYLPGKLLELFDKDASKVDL